MKKIITGFGDPIQLEGSYNPTSWVVRVFEVNGHREISARNTVDWEEVPYKPVLDLFPDQPSLEQLQEAEDRKQANIKRAAIRAKTMCRRVIKAEGFNEMLTLTYRENQCDRELCKKHFKEWARRMKRALGEFRYCASFEKQDRGAMHVHIATHQMPQYGKYGGLKIKSWQLGTKIWRSIVGADNGLCFVGGRNGKGNQRTKRMSLARMAAYISKYIMKDYEDAPDESNRYSRSNGTALPKPVTMYFQNMTMMEILDLAFECGEGDVILSHHVDIARGSYWLCTEPGELRPDKYPQFH